MSLELVCSPQAIAVRTAFRTIFRQAIMIKCMILKYNLFLD